MARNARRHSTVAPQKVSTHSPRWYWATLPIVILAAAVLYWWTRPIAFVIRPSDDRNVLLVTIDTLRADALGTYGGRASTPNLDRLAAQGARFTFAHAHSVLTLPSHVTILTGRYPYQHGVRNNA